MNRLLKILTAFVLGISLLTACEDNGWEKGSAKLEKSRYISPKAADFVQMTDRSGQDEAEDGYFPKDIDEISFTVVCRSDKQYFYGEGGDNSLEVKKDGEWYKLAYKKESWKAAGWVLNRNFKTNLTFYKSDFDYDFEAGEYRYIMPITAEGDAEESLIIYYFRLFDSYPFGDISADDIESCIATDMWTNTKLNDKQTQKLLETVRMIKLKNDSKVRSNDYLGGGEYFEIQLKNGEKIRIHIMPNNDEIIINGFVYQSVDNKTNELKELYDSVQNNAAVEKSRYTDIENPEKMKIEADNGEFPTDFIRIQLALSFYDIFGDDKYVYYEESAANTLEVKKDGEWYVIPNKNDSSQAHRQSLNEYVYHPFAFDRYDYSYHFKAGEYRYILNISCISGKEEKQTPTVFHFKLVDRDSGKFFRPYEDISKDDIESCCANSYFGGTKELTDDQTDELLDIIKEIELVRGSERPNDYAGGGPNDFIITLKSGKKVGICASIGSVCEYLLDDGMIYRATVSKNDELYELYHKLFPLPETSEESK